MPSPRKHLRAFTHVVPALTLLLCAASLYAQKKSAPAPAKAAPVSHAAAPAATHAAAPSAATHTTAGATTAAHGPTTAGAATASHGPTTAGATTASHGATTAGATTAGHPATTTATAGRPGTTSMGGARGAEAGGPGHAGGPGNAPRSSAMSRPAPRGATEHRSAAGEARMRPDGHPADVHNARLGMDVHHNLGGGRRVESVRPDGRRFVSERGRPGYIGHPYAYRGHEFEHRAYYDHGRMYNRYYAGYHYRGYDMHVYAPGRYYPAAYYGWAYRPWGAPIRYGWGFAGNPWYGYYGAYYQPYPVYSSPSLWLTDYMLSQTLSAAYTARMEAGADAGPAQAAYAGPALPPEAKQMIANEVQNDLALEAQEATTNGQQNVPDPRQSSVARLMEDGKPHAFVAGREVDVVDLGGNECALTDGDVVALNTPPGAQDANATVVVMASKGGKDCARGTQVAVGIDELQEMDNHLREQVDSGLQALAAAQGKNGLPPAPAAAMAPPADALVAQGAPPPDPAGAQELAQQDTQAQQAETEVLGGAAAPAKAAPAGNEDLFHTPQL